MFSAPVNESGESPIEERRHFERLKYALLYEEYGYAMGKDRLEALWRWLDDEIILERPLKTWLDVGCGKGETRELATEADLVWRGAEVLETLAAPVIEDVVLVWGVHELSYPPERLRDTAWRGMPIEKHDLVTCLDVLEHILPDDTEAALSELWRVTGKVLLLTISWCEDDGGKQIGAKLHINIRSQEEWVDLIERAVSDSATIRVFDADGSGGTFEVRR